MVYQLRIYRTLRRQTPRLLERLGDRTLAIWARLGLRPVGFWVTAVGAAEGSALTYLLAWDSMSDRETRWAALQIDSTWKQVNSRIEAGGFLVASIDSRLLAPTEISAIR